MVKRISIISILIALLITSCNYKKRIPKEFPKEKEFAQILADIHFTEATINQIRIKHRGVDSTANSYYHDVLAKYELTQEKFDTIVSWYLAHPDLYQGVYDDAIGLLSEQEAKWQREVKVIKEEEEKQRKEKEARNVWPMQKAYSISNRDTFDRRIPFAIDVDTIEAEGYRVSAFYQFLKGSIVKDPVLEVFALYKDSTRDTLTYKLPATYTNSKAELTIGIHEKEQIIKLEGFLVNHDTTYQIRARIKNIEFEYIPKLDSISVE
ncbi:DUF4296 domain-containing protein [Labilibacter sediminis]|nr:DUF4296 domain-containing protein [Labilibacter sediminis]